MGDGHPTQNRPARQLLNLRSQVKLELKTGLPQVIASHRLSIPPWEGHQKNEKQNPKKYFTKSLCDGSHKVRRALKNRTKNVLGTIPTNGKIAPQVSFFFGTGVGRLQCLYAITRRRVH